MPCQWTKTTEFPHTFLSSSVDSPSFNSASYILFSNVHCAATSKQINRWRRLTLGIGNTDMGHTAQSKITFIYNFSRVVVPKPLDWPDTTITPGIGSLIIPTVTLIGLLPKSGWLLIKLIRMANLLCISGLGVSRSRSLTRGVYQVG